MISLAPTLPPIELSDSAMKLASTLLQIAVDPNATAARLTELDTATKAYRAVIDEHAAAKVAADSAAAGLADLQQREQDLASRQDALAAAQTQLEVASAAVAGRAKALDDREIEIAKHEQELATKIQQHAALVAQTRAALA